jgi:hypothetical protein
MDIKSAALPLPIYLHGLHRGKFPYPQNEPVTELLGEHNAP